MTMYLVIIPNAWGRGKSAIEAANVARKELGKRPGKRLPSPRMVFSYDPKKTTKAYVDEMGSLCWLGERPVTVEKVGLTS